MTTVPKVEAIDLDTVYRVLSSRKISSAQKKKFIENNSSKIKSIAEFQITSKDFSRLMEERPLIKFKPVKNSITKYGDKIILAKSLGIQPSEVADYIKNVTEDIKEVNELTFLPPDTLDQIKTYIFRHGSKDQLVTFLDYELHKTGDVVKTIYRTLEYHTGGVADYFIRPIHKLDNNTLVRIYNTVDKHLDIARTNGLIDQEQNDKIARDALIRIYKIQNNNRLINAVKTAKTLNG